MINNRIKKLRRAELSRPFQFAIQRALNPGAIEIIFSCLKKHPVKSKNTGEDIGNLYQLLLHESPRSEGVLKVKFDHAIRQPPSVDSLRWVFFYANKFCIYVDLDAIYNGIVHDHRKQWAMHGYGAY